MHSDTERLLDVWAMATDGTLYRIERHCRIAPDSTGSEYFFCCLPDGQLVICRGDGDYELPDGTIVRTVASRLVQ